MPSRGPSATISDPSSLDHIRAAFDPLGERVGAPPPERPRGKIYVCGETAHAAGGPSSAARGRGRWPSDGGRSSICARNDRKTHSRYLPQHHTDVSL